MAKVEYKQIDTSTLKGLQQAERLKANGWEITRVGLFIIQFRRIQRNSNAPSQN